MTKGRVVERQNREFAIMGTLTQEQRECVHEYGFTIVEHLMKHGVTRPAAIRELVRVIWDGARQPAQRLYGRAGSSVVNKLDWVLIQANSPVSARTLARLLSDQNFVIAPQHPTAAMISASMTAIEGYGLLSKREKHQIRLMAALKAAFNEMWADQKPSRATGEAA